MPPLICCDGFGLVWRLTTITPSTVTLRAKRSTSSTLPVLPLSRPAMMRTRSSFLILTRSGWRSPFCCLRSYATLDMLDDLRREGNDFHEALIAQFARHGAEHARADRLADFANQHGGIRIEADVGTVLAAGLRPHPHDHAAHHFPLLDIGIGRGFLHARGNHIA